MRVQRLNVNAVLVGDRYRSTLGDLTALMRSMASEGQLQPILVLDNHELLAGERRLEAARRLGWADIKAYTARTLADAIAALRADWASATDDSCLPMSMTERVSQVELLQAMHERERTPAPKGIPRAERWTYQADPIMADLLGIGMTRYRLIRLAVLTAAGRRPYPRGRPVTDLDRKLAQQAIKDIDGGIAVDTVGTKLRSQLGYPRNSKIPVLPTDPDRIPAVRYRTQRSNRRPPLLDQFSASVSQLLVTARRLEKLTQDDRWRAQREKVPPAVRLSLSEALNQLAAVQRQVPPPTGPTAPEPTTKETQ
jgi:hypothetical protein